MLSDKEIEKLAEPIIRIYNEIEYELVKEIARRFDTYETIGGSLEWQLKMLQKMGVLNADCVKTIAKYSTRTDKEINEMLKKAGMANFSQSEMDSAFADNLIMVNYKQALSSPELARIINLTKTDIGKTIKLINTKCLESSSQAYMDIINKAYIETATGLRSYNEAITKALKDMALKGIAAATYKRIDKDGNEKLVNYSLEGIVRRDVITAVNSLANKASIEYARDIGYEYVEVSQHLGARVTKNLDFTNHAWWQGKVYKIEGSTPQYPNLIEVTGYGNIQGLGGINCRHRTYPFIPGVSKPQEPINQKENANRYEAEQDLRRMERHIRELRRMREAMRQANNKEEARKLKNRILAYSDKIDAFCKRKKLKRQENRETI